MCRRLTPRSIKVSMIPIEEKDYSDGRTKQSFKDATDINKLIYRHAKAGTLSHLEKFGGQYGDFSDFDFFEAQTRLARARSIFEQLPAETRKEFGNDPSTFFEFVSTRTAEELRTDLPELAEKGRQMPDVMKRRQTGSAAAQAPEEPAATPAQGNSGTPADAAPAAGGS